MIVTNLVQMNILVQTNCESNWRTFHLGGSHTCPVYATRMVVVDTVYIALDSNLYSGNEIIPN